MLSLNTRGLIRGSFTVNKYDAVSSICEKSQANFKVNDLLFIHKNHALSPALSFAFYGISDNDQIFIYPKKQVLPPKNEYVMTLKANNHGKTFTENKVSNQREVLMSVMKGKTKLSINQQSTKKVEMFKQMNIISPIVEETARISDLVKVKIENTPSAYRKILSNYEMFCRLPRFHQKPTETVVPQSSEEPSKDILPYEYDSQ